MKTERIISYLKRHKLEIIKILSENNWRHFRDYFFIREKYLSNDLDDKFKRVFCSFYIMNGPMGMNDMQKAEFFKLLSLRETDLVKVLKSLNKIPGYRNSRKIFLSFGTKLLHTVDEKLPIYDRNIAYVLELPAQAPVGTLEEKMKNRIDIYDELKKKFITLLANNKMRIYLKDIKQELQRKSELDKFQWQDKNVSDTKLLDSLLWALYSCLK